jgi:hypothetical protein
LHSIAARNKGVFLSVDLHVMAAPKAANTLKLNTISLMVYFLTYDEQK